MILPPYFLPRPPCLWDSDTIAAFERLFAEAVERGPSTPIRYMLPAPKWQFLSFVCERKDVLLHGSGNPDIAELAPRKSEDVDPFGNREAVYAAADGIWSMFFAIVDRDRPLTSLVNSCTRIFGATGASEPFYYFSIDADDLPGEPWRNGTVYLLPAATFERQALKSYRGMEIESAQLASLVPVRPLAKLSVEPADFPFLDQVRRHDPVALRARAYADPAGFPWLDV